MAGRRRVVTAVVAAVAALAVAGGGAYGMTRLGEDATTSTARPAATSASPSTPSATATPSAPATTPAAVSAAVPAAPAPPPPPVEPPPPPPPVAGPPILEPGNESEQVRELQARLAQIRWFSAKPTGTYGKTTTASVSGFQGKRGLPVNGYVDQATWDRLLDMTHEPTQEELFPPDPPPAAAGDAAGLDPRCLTGRALCIDKSTNKLTWVVDGQAQTTLAVRFGSELTPTREGAFSVNSKSRDHVSSLYDTPMPYAMFFSGGQAVHYSPDFAARGYNGSSHGCVNVRDKGGIAALYGEVSIGDKVIVYRS